MSDENSFSYCDSDEECFIGKITEKELRKRALLGLSPVQISPQRNEALNESRNLPDVLTGSTSVNVNSAAEQCPCPSPTSSPNIESYEIDLDSTMNSVQIISDDESFLLNEKKVLEENISYCDLTKENVELNKSLENVKEVKIVDNTIITVETMNKPSDEINTTNETASKNSIDECVKTITVEEYSESRVLNMLEPTSHDLSMNSLTNLEDTKSPIVQEKCLPGQELSSTLNNTDYIPISGISDSILNISHFSSTPSPAATAASEIISSDLITTVVYEDISFDENQVFGSENRSSATAKQEQTDDLHMSVDETDYQQNLTVDNLEIIPESERNKSSVSSYHTADTMSGNATFKPYSDSFKSYREHANDSCSLAGLDVGVDQDIKETSFELIVQNRQNSFISSTSSDVKVETTTDQIKPTVISKLPIYNHSAKSLVQPSKLNFKYGYLKSKSDAWAKKMQTVDSKTNKLNEANALKKDVKCTLPTPNKPKGLQQSNGKGSNKKVGICSSNIPTINKTPTTAHRPSRLVKSDAKAPLTPSSLNTMSAEKKIQNKFVPPSLFKEKNRYKNIISPVQAYISGSPPVLQKRTDISEEIKIVVDAGNKNTKSHLPRKINSASSSSAANVAKRLIYEKGQEQENCDPNYPRDSLPTRFLENSDAVFMKEPEPPKRYLPQMGQKLHKLLDTPRPKIVVHQGRVKHSPNTKGVLSPNVNVKSTENRLDLPAERVSIRIEKTANITNVLK